MPDVVELDVEGMTCSIALSRATLAKIRQNLFFALVYNVLGLPVVSNSLLLNRWKPSS